MPKNLLLVRHGESEGNIAVARSKRGDDSAYSEEFRNRHSSLWRLSEKGKEQAKTAGDWLRKHWGEAPFFRHYTSEYLRAMETAALLCIPDAEWYTDFYLRERNWGELDCVTIKERNERFHDAMKQRMIDPFYWTPPNGESLADLCLRVDRVLQTLHRECENRDVIIVCHGEVMWAFRVRLERMSQERFRELENSKDKSDRIHNCQIHWYTRVDPDRAAENHRHFNWVKSVCPWEMGSGDGGWRQIVRPRYSNSDLLERVARTPPLVV